MSVSLPSDHPSSIHPTTHSCIHPSVQHPCIHPFIQQTASIHEPIHSFINPSPIQASIYSSNCPSLIQQSMHLTIHASICSSNHPIIHASIYQFMHSSIHPAVHLTIHKSIYLSTNPDIHPYKNSRLHSFIQLSKYCPFIRSNNPYIHPPISPSICLSRPVVLRRVGREGSLSSHAPVGRHSNDSPSVTLDDSALDSCDKAFSPLIWPRCAAASMRLTITRAQQVTKGKAEPNSLIGGRHLGCKKKTTQNNIFPSTSI